MKQKSKNFILFITAILLISSCKKTTESDTDWGSADFTSYVAIGNSLTAGVSDGALYEETQINSFPQLIADAAGINDFEQPIMGGNGFSFDETEGKLLLSPNFTLDFLSPGEEINRNLNRAYNNLGIPLIRANQVLNAKTPADANDNHFFDKVLRNSGRTQIQEALSLDPTFITLWVGSNDVLEAATTGLADERYPYTNPEDFEDEMNAIINQLIGGTDAPILIANIFDITDLPYFSSLPSLVKNPTSGESAYLFGECENGIVRMLTDDDLVLFWALPDYFNFRSNISSISQATALNDTLVLDSEEKGEIQDKINKYNDIIKQIAESNNQIYLVDMYNIFKNIADSGYDFDGFKYLTDIVIFDDDGVLNFTNTLFSIDGLHPNRFGYAFFANTFISMINSSFNSSLPFINNKMLNDLND